MIPMKRLFENLDAALFDLDGTLVETNIDFPLMRREMLRLAEEAGVDDGDLPNKDILGIVHCAEEKLGPKRGREFRDRAFAILEEIELRHSQDTQEILCARELLEKLKERGARIGVVTRNCRAASEISLTAAGLDPDLLLCREDVRLTKPHPHQLLLALSRLGAEPERSVMIGDHTMDVTAGKAAGMRTIGLLTAGRPADFFESAAPDAVASSLKDILDAIVDSDR